MSSPPRDPNARTRRSDRSRKQRAADWVHRDFYRFRAFTTHPLWIKVASANPVLLAFSLAALVAAIPLVLVLFQQKEIETQADNIATTQAALIQQQADTQRNRTAVTTAICEGLNRNARANNGQTAYLEGIIQLSAETSPRPNAQELADKISKDLRKLAVPSIPCREFIDLVARLIPPRSGANARDFRLPEAPPEFPPIPDIVRRAGEP